MHAQFEKPNRKKTGKKVIAILAGLLGLASIANAQTYNPSLFNCIKWRMIGPYRGGRVVGACGVPQQPGVFYMGVNNGGVWKTNDYGRTWNPIFDKESTGSIGDVAVAPSNPDVIYVGSGEGLQRPDLSVGNGIYKSADAGKTWVHLGLSDGQQVGGLAVDPKDENKVFVAMLGHPYGPNAERGVFRSIDGGKHWDKVLYVDDNTGAIQVTIDPSNSNIVYADMWAARMAPWEDGYFAAKTSGLYKSVDGGTTWKRLTNGLPGADEGLGRIGFGIAPSNGNRLYATVDAKKNGGIYRSDDGGESWTKISDDKRLWDRGDDFAEIKVDPKNADIVYDANVVVWKSTDGGKTWNGFKGAPGGDDYHRIWINPDNTKIMMLGVDQGGIITVNGGETWSSWYNQPTAQFYHVSADNAFPYNVYSGQQESGSICISSRGNDGEITFREWHPVGAEEYGYVVADPMDPNIVYGGKLSKYNKLTAQTQYIAPIGNYRFIRTAPIVFSPIDNKTLYYAGNVLFKTKDGGNSWQVISPDLTSQTYDVAPCIGVYASDSMKTMKRRGVIYTIAPSPVDSNTIWCGTDDGYIQVTHNGGKTWTNVTPPGLKSWSKISLMDASHTDVNTAYAAVNCIRLDDMHPHIYRTTDGGKTWQEIVNGLPDQPVNVVKEDPIRKGLLFAGSETETSVSFDNGDHWQSLRLNMPATSIRDLTIKDNDLIVATHGRSFWILDDIMPLRQVSEEVVKHDATLYKPEPAYRVRWDLNTDTPLPGDEPAGQNPPDGAIIDYHLSKNIKGEVTLDILDTGNHVISHYSSRDSLYKIPSVNIPLYWIRPQQVLSADSGSHRFLWDMHYQRLNLPIGGYPIAAVVGLTARDANSPWVMPGIYTARFTVNGKSYKQQFSVIMDPRVETPIPALQQQFDMSMICYNGEKEIIDILHDIHSLQAQVKNIQVKASGDEATNLKSFSAMLSQFENVGVGTGTRGFKTMFNSFASMQGILQGADVQPTTQCMFRVQTTQNGFVPMLAEWKKFIGGIPALNKKLKSAGLATLKL